MEQERLRDKLLYDATIARNLLIRATNVPSAVNIKSDWKRDRPSFSLFLCSLPCRGRYLSGWVAAKYSHPAKVWLTARQNTLMSVLSLGARVLELNAVMCVSEFACVPWVEMEVGVWIRDIGENVCIVMHVCVCHDWRRQRRHGSPLTEWNFKSNILSLCVSVKYVSTAGSLHSHNWCFNVCVCWLHIPLQLPNMYFIMQTFH